MWEGLQSTKRDAKECLPWYDAKELLAQTYRLEARTHKTNTDYAAVEAAIESLSELESEYYVDLGTDADRRVRAQLH